jgi:DNA-binding IscR family transcriptional regulator/tetratricopeptide (TPR) repeat protein
MRRLDIAPLEGRDAVRLSQVLLGGSSATAPLARFLAERTGGNPFFLEETVAALAEEGILQGRRGSYRLSAGRGLDDAHAMPPNVRAVIAARMDRLPPDDKCVLQAASVVGNEFRAAVVAAVAELPEPLVCSALDRLHQAGFIHSDAGDGGGAFRHVLVQEVAYEGILHARRREMHARVVAATERLHPDRLTEQAEALARHAAIGHVWDRAVEHAGRAADRAAARNANREAVAFYDDALDALGHLPHDDPAALRLAVDLRFAARTPLFRLGEIGRTLERLREAAGPAERLGDTARLGQLAIFLSHISWLSGKHAEAVAEGERARRIAAVRGDAALAARADFQVGLGALGMCDFGEAARLMQATAQRALAPQVADRYGLDAPLAVVALGYRARALAELGAFTEAEDAVDACSVLAADVNRPFTSIFAAIAAGHLCLAGGRCGDAVPRLTEAVALCRLADAALMKPVAKALLGAAWVGAGQAGDGVRSLRSAVADAARMGFLFLQPQRLTMLAEALLSIGRPAEASRLAARALSLAKQQGERGPAAAALLVSARVADAGGRAAEAHSLATTAAARAALLGMRPLAVKATSFAAQLQVPDGATD